MTDKELLDLYSDYLISSFGATTGTGRTQTNHLFAALCGYVKLELLKTQHRRNHFALKARHHVRALQLAFAELQQLQPVALAA